MEGPGVLSVSSVTSCKRKGRLGPIALSRSCGFCHSRCRAAALLVFLAAAAEARVVAADFGAFAFHRRAGLVELAGVDPASILATEQGDLEMLLVLALGL